MNRLMHINVNSMVFLDKLGNDFDLPITPELEKAVLTINKACFEEVQRREVGELDKFLSDKFYELNEIMNKHVSTEKKKRLMLDIVNFKRKDKLKL